MKNRSLLLYLLFPLLLVGCLQPDDDVDLPEPAPQKPISELIQNDWESYKTTFIDSSGNETAYYGNGYVSAYIFYENSYFAFNYPYEGGAGGRYGDYKIFESGGKKYIEIDEDVGGHAVYQITSITDSTMTWEMTDSLAQLSDAYQGQHFIKEFRLLKFSPAVRILGNWNATKSSKVTYDASGNVISSEQVTSDIKLLQFAEDDNVFVYRNEANSDAAYSYRLTGGAAYTSLRMGPVIDYSAPPFADIITLSGNRMILKQKVSPTISYITEFTRVAKPTVPVTSVAAKIIGEWVEQNTTPPGGETYKLDGTDLQIYTNPNKLDGTYKYSVIERDGKAYLSYLLTEYDRYNYEITQLSDSGMTWVPVNNKPFLPGYNEDTYGRTTVFTRSK